MSKVFSKKHLLACLVVSLVLIIAGAVVFGLLGFSKDSTVRDKISVEVNGYISLLSEESRGEFLDFCEDTLEADGYSVLEVNYNSETSGFNDSVEFVIAADTDTYTDQQLSALAETLQTSINGLSDDQIENIESVVQFAPSVTYTVTQNNVFATYAWRAAVAGASVLVIAFIYAAIRFRPGMGLTVLVSGVHDVLLTLALIALLRIPVGVTLIAVAAFSLLVSVGLNLAVCGGMRKNFRLDEWKDIPSREAVTRSVKESRRIVFGAAVALAAFVILIGVVGAVLGTDLAFAMIGGLLAVIVSVYSALLLGPSVFAGIKARTDKRRAERARYDYVPEKERKKRGQETKQTADGAAE